MMEIENAICIYLISNYSEQPLFKGELRITRYCMFDCYECIVSLLMCCTNVGHDFQNRKNNQIPWRIPNEWRSQSQLWLNEGESTVQKDTAELRKESDFLKKQRHSLRRKSIRGSSISFRNTTIIGGSDDFNTLKNDLIYQHYYRTEKELYTAIKEFAYVQYNHVHPHSYNDYKTPYETRYGVV